MHPPRFLPTHRLLDWPDCFLELHCCKGTTVYPVWLLAQKHGNRSFADVLKRLRCQKCRRFQPAPVYLCASPNRAFQGGAQPEWAIELVPAPQLR